MKYFNFYLFLSKWGIFLIFYIELFLISPLRRNYNKKIKHITIMINHWINDNISYKKY